MQYLVVGSDGQEYGPAEVLTLSKWANEGRLHPTSSLKDPTTGAVITADKVPGIFPQAPPPLDPPSSNLPQPGNAWNPNGQPMQDWSKAPSNYNRPMPNAKVGASTGNRYFWNSIIRSFLALIFFFVLGGIGLVFSGYAVYFGYQAMQQDHKLGKVAFGISVVVLVAVIIGWALRIQSGAAGGAFR